MGIANKALNLCYYEMLGNAANVNLQSQKYFEVTANDLKLASTKILPKTIHPRYIIMQSSSNYDKQIHSSTIKNY
jgi:hypothetical protein